MKDEIRAGIAQITPVWLDRDNTTAKIIDYLNQAAEQDCELLVFGESILPGYPFWLSITDGASFNSEFQKEIHAHYMKNAVQIERGDLGDICQAVRSNRIATYLGIVERAGNRGGHSLYCSLVFIDASGEIRSVHRKLQPTYEERLCWAPGDGNGLVVHHMEPFTLGGLNCWENWMPLPRAALYGMGENLHIAVWPGSIRNTADISRYIAVESRSYVISASGLLHRHDIPDSIPHANEIRRASPDILANGGSCIAAPDGSWVEAPVIEKETLIIHTLDIKQVYRERQNFDPSGHYSRPDVARLTVNRDRQSILDLR